MTNTPDDVGEPSAACTHPSASSRTHEPHIGDHGEQDAVLPKKRSPVYPRTVHGQERPYKYVYCDDEYPDDVGEPSAACTDLSASSRTHEPHIGDYGEQDAVLLKKRSPVHPRTVDGKCVPCWLKRTANVVRSWCVPETSNLKKRASADVHRMRVAGAVPEDVFFEHISGAVLVHIANEGTFTSSSCDDEYPDDVGEPSAACTDPSASSRTHEPHIGDHVEQDAVLPKKRSPVYPRTVHGQERPYKYVWTANVVRSWCVPEASNLEKRASADVHPVRVAGAVPEDVFFEHISGAVLVHIANEGTFTSSSMRMCEMFCKMMYAYF
ncbi:unnamed protein product [Pieris macdunnoughi]|uniref:Uncharacterized protein n=1 Tax=Pieris macdunnoughi TaxID=345717 RepID=A0A821T998_9NEOP|nr:unnamed protein product [Pieris macdunnoughi]